MLILTLSSLDHTFKCYSTKRQLVKNFNVSRNLSSWFSATSRGISLLCFQPINIPIGLFLPLLGLTWNIELSFCFVKMGWFPIRISDTFRFSPIYELSAQMAESSIFYVRPRRGRNNPIEILIGWKHDKEIPRDLAENQLDMFVKTLQILTCCLLVE